MLNIINTLKTNIQAEGCYPYVGEVETLLNSRINDYPLVGIQFEDATLENEQEISYHFSIYYMEQTSPDIANEIIWDRGIKTLSRIINDLPYTNATFEAFLQRFSDITTGIVLSVYISGENDLC